MSANKVKDLLYCSFCGKPQGEVKKLIAGPQVYICDECIALCNDIIFDENKTAAASASEGNSFPTPKEIIAFLDKHVIGQERAKKILAVAVYDHYKRLLSLKSGGQKSMDDVELAKSNVLLAGPTGSGKTLLAQMLARFLRVPFVQADATELTEAGYVGKDVQDIFRPLLEAADNDIEKAQRGIVYIDEIDKTARRSGSLNGRDVSGEGVQQALLKILEASIVSVPTQAGKKQGDVIELDTTNILFICGGAFDGIDKIVSARTLRSGIGFSATVYGKDARSVSRLYSDIEPEDCIAYGLIPEIVGRLPVIAALHELDEEALVRILTEPQNALVKQFKKLFAIDGIELDVTEQALRAVARRALMRKTGARALRAILERALLDAKIEAPSEKANGLEKIILTEGAVLGKEKVQYVRKAKIPLLPGVCPDELS
jgi:ATP-dependent Clp protease ATP-binding subunit ClpX